MRSAGTQRAVFLDRDGVIVVPEFRDGRSFAPTTIERFRIYDSAPDCLRALKQAGFLLIVVTNQPDLGNGLITPSIMDEMNRRMRAVLSIDDVQICPHRRDDLCRCRKPLPGLLLGAAVSWGIALDRSFMIGDRESDIVAGHAAGCRTVFIDHDYIAEPKPQGADFNVRSLQDATACICAAIQE